MYLKAIKKLTSKQQWRKLGHLSNLKIREERNQEQKTNSLVSNVKNN